MDASWNISAVIYFPGTAVVTSLTLVLIFDSFYVFISHHFPFCPTSRKADTWMFLSLVLLRVCGMQPLPKQNPHSRLVL